MTLHPPDKAASQKDKQGKLLEETRNLGKNQCKNTTGAACVWGWNVIICPNEQETPQLSPKPWQPAPHWQQHGREHFSFPAAGCAPQAAGREPRGAESPWQTWEKGSGLKGSWHHQLSALVALNCWVTRGTENLLSCYSRPTVNFHQTSHVLLSASLLTFQTGLARHIKSEPSIKCELNPFAKILMAR